MRNHYQIGLDALGASGPDAATALAIQKELQQKGASDAMPWWQWPLIVGGCVVGLKVLGKYL